MIFKNETTTTISEIINDYAKKNTSSDQFKQTTSIQNFRLFG